MQNCLRFFWFRESLPGHLEQDRGLRIAPSGLLPALLGLHPGQSRTSTEPPIELQQVLAALSGSVPLDVLPLWARKRLALTLGPLGKPADCELAARNAAILAAVARRISALVTPGEELEIHLPYIDRKGWPHRFQFLENTTFARAAGRILPEELLDPVALDDYNCQLLLICATQPGPEVDLVFTDTRRAHPGLLPALLPVTAPVRETSGEAALVELRVAIPGTACRAWHTAPPEADTSYFEVHAPVSRALQHILRRWFVWNSLADIEGFTKPDPAYLALGYFVTTPFPGRRRTDFTYDTFGAGWMEAAFRHARSNLRPLLVRIKGVLLASGGKNLAGDFSPRDLRYILGRVRKERGAIRNLISAEADIINYIFKFGIELQGATEPVRLLPRCADFMKGLRLRLRRMFRERYCDGLASMLLIETTHALALAQGRESTLVASLSLTPLVAATPQALETPLLEPVPC